MRQKQKYRERERERREKEREGEWIYRISVSWVAFHDFSLESSTKRQIPVDLGGGSGGMKWSQSIPWHTQTADCFQTESTCNLHWSWNSLPQHLTLFSLFEPHWNTLELGFCEPVACGHPANCLWKPKYNIDLPSKQKTGVNQFWARGSEFGEEGRQFWACILGVNFWGRGLTPWKNKAKKLAEQFCHQNSLRDSPASF